MTQEIIRRSLQLDTIEFEGGEGRTLHARLFKWDTISRVQDSANRLPYDEEWMRGVFSQSIKRAERMKRGWPLMYNHAVNALPVGAVAMVHERDDGPWMTSKISRTQLGDDIIELIKDGVLPGVSVNGRNIKSRRGPNGRIQRMEVALDEISLTPFPQLVGSDELVLRAFNSGFTSVTDMLEHEELDEEHEEKTPVRDELAEFLSQLDDPTSDRVG